MRYSTWQGKPCVLSDGPFPIIGLLPEPSPQEQFRRTVYLAAITGAAIPGDQDEALEQHVHAITLAGMAVAQFFPPLEAPDAPQPPRRQHHHARNQ